MMRKVRILAIPAVLAVIPALRYFSEFRAGARCGPYMTGTGFIVFLLLPWLVGLFSCLVVPLSKIWQRLIVGVVSGLLVWPITLIFTPAGAVIYSRGFEHAITKDPGLPKLQKWVTETLGTFEEGQSHSNKDPTYRSPGNILLSRESLPDFLQNGLFATADRKDKGPEISVCTNESGPTSIAISWYLHGIVVGPKDFQCNWNYWYIKQLAPGIYSYHLEK